MLICHVCLTIHIIGRYNNIGQYMIHRVYICVNLNSPFVAHNCDPIEDCTSNNLAMQCSSNFSLTTQVKFKEWEHMFLVSTNLLQDSIEKDGVHHDHGTYKFANIYNREHIQTNWIYGHVSSQSVSFHYFGHPFCSRDVQHQFQTLSKPRTAFHQEGEDDEDM